MSQEASSKGSGLKQFMPTPGAKQRYFTLEEVTQHNTANDCWVILFGEVYSLTVLIQNNIESMPDPMRRKRSTSSHPRSRNWHYILVRQHHSIASLQGEHGHGRNRVLLPGRRVLAAEGRERNKVVERSKQYNRQTHQEEQEGEADQHAHRPCYRFRCADWGDNQWNSDPLQEAQQAWQ